MTVSPLCNTAELTWMVVYLILSLSAVPRFRIWGCIPPFLILGSPFGDNMTNDCYDCLNLKSKSQSLNIINTNFTSGTVLLQVL